MAHKDKGTGHFFWQRITALANIPLAIFFLAVLIAHSGADHARVAAFLSRPLIAVLMLLLVLSGIYHARLGMQTIIDDYVHGKKTKCLSLILNDTFTFAIAAGCVAAIVKLVLM